MPTNNPRTSQLKQRTNLKQLGQVADKFLSEVLDATDLELDYPLKMAATFPVANAVLNFSSSQINSADAGKKVVSPVKKQIFNALNTPTINFQTLALSNAAHFDIVFPVSTVGFFRNVGFTLIGSGKIKALFSAESATEGGLTNAGALFVSGGLPLGYITLVATATTPAFKTAGSATNIIENAKFFRFGSGAGGSSSGSGTGTGAEVIDLRFRAELQDSLSDIPDGTTPVDIGSNKTDPSLFDVANELFRIKFDATRTVTGTGTSMSLSAAPNFTVVLGDVLVVGQEVREITALGSINTTGAGFTIASAFTVNPTALQATVSEAVYTQDLNAFTAGGTGLAVSSQITDNVSKVMVNYEDSTALNDVIPDWGTAPAIAYHVTGNNTTWGNKQVRATNLSSTNNSVNVPLAGTQLRIRFFAAPISGSGAVNLISYKAFWHEQVSDPSGSNYNTAFARPTSSIAVNVTHSVAGGKSRFTFPFSYGRGLNAGNPSGSALEVYANGQQVPRFESGITDNTQSFFTEVSDNIIDMDVDYSASGLEFIFKVPVTVVDSNTSNTNRIANLETKIAPNEIFNGNMDFWQRGTSLVSGTGPRYIADRFVNESVGSTYTVARQNTVFTEPFSATYFHRTAVTSVANVANNAFLSQKIESVVNSAGTTKTLSFWAKADSAKPISVEFVQNFGTGGSPSTSVTGLGVTKFNLTTSWQRFIVTVVLPSISGRTLGTNLNDHLAMNLWFDAGSNFNARTNTLGQQSGTFDIAQVKLETGTSASSFVLSGGSLAYDLSNCQRFYEIVAGFDFRVYGAAADSYRSPFFWKVTKRAVPTVTPNITGSSNGTTSIISITVSGAGLNHTISSLGGGGSSIAPIADAEL